MRYWVSDPAECWPHRANPGGKPRTPTSFARRLASGAEVSCNYSATSWNDGERILKLKGQVYFEVKKGSKFSVRSTQGIVSVLGTSFNIYDREGAYKVECFTGKVKVESIESETKVYLTKGLKTSKKNILFALSQPDVTILVNNI